MHGSAEISGVSGSSLGFVPQISFSQYCHSGFVMKEVADQTLPLVRVVWFVKRKSKLK